MAFQELVSLGPQVSLGLLKSASALLSVTRHGFPAVLVPRTGLFLVHAETVEVAVALGLALGLAVALGDVLALALADALGEALAAASGTSLAEVLAVVVGVAEDSRAAAAASAAAAQEGAGDALALFHTP